MADDDIGLDEDKSKKKISKTTWIYLGLAGGALVLTYLIYEHSKQGSSSGSSQVGGAPVSPGADIAVPASGNTYEPGTEMQAYQQGIQDAISLLQAQPGTGAEGSAATTPSTSSGSGTSSATSPSSSSGSGSSTSYKYPPIVQTAQGPMYVLGPGADGPNDYHVYGGAPVYFGNTNQLAQGTSDQWSNGQFYAYTPVAYKNMIFGNGIPTP
jgi:hypothetical protein